jgi:hypothetical protein
MDELDPQPIHVDADTWDELHQVLDRSPQAVPELVELFATPSILERRPDEAFKQRLAASMARNRALLDRLAQT